MESKLEELTKRIEALEKGQCQPQVKKKKEKREPSEKQKEQHARFKKAYDKWAPEFKKEDPNLKSHEIFKKVHAKMKE